MISAVIFTPQWFSNLFNGLFLTIDYVIYLAIDICYQVFEYVSRIEVFSTEHVAEITSRIYTILGIVMLFVFAYNIILAIVNPDSMNKGDKSMKSIVQNTVISIVMVTLFPLVCEYLQVFQNHIINDNTIGKLIMGDLSNNNSHSALNVATTIFTAFYHPVNENKQAVTMADCAETDSELAQGVEICAHYNELAEKAGNSLGDFAKFLGDQDLKDGIYEGDMEYLFPLSTIAGVVAAYLFLSFSLDLGVRAAKLGLLKLIAPIPIFLRITKPKGGQFDKWLSDFSKTYLQVFERVVIIYFAMLLISYLSDIIQKHPTVQVSINETYSPSVFIRLVGMVIIILGILKFAKDAPKMLEDVFMVKIPAMRLKDKLNDNEYAKRAVGLAGAGLGALGKPLYNNIKGNFIKDPTTGKRHIMRGIGRTVGGTLKDLPGALPGVFNSARRGWQNGNVSNWGDMGNAIGGARAQNETDMNALKNKVHNGLNNLKDPEKWLEQEKANIGEGLENFFNGSEVTNEKLTAAKSMQSMFKTLFDTFTDTETENARKSALKDYQNGKSVKFRKAVKGTDGHTYGAGESVPVTALDPELINDHFEALQRETIEKKFKDKAYGQALKEQGKIICAQMEKTINTLGEDARKAILVDNHIDNIGELNEIFKRASEQKATIADIETLRKVSDSIDKQVKVNKFANNVESQKDKK